MKPMSDWLSIASNVSFMLIAAYSVTTRPQVVFDSVVFALILCLFTTAIVLPIFFCWKVVFGR